MNNKELLLNKINQDWEAYKTDEFSRSKDEIFSNSYENMVAIQCKEFLDKQVIESIESWENSEEVYETLLDMSNIIDEFADYIISIAHFEATEYCYDDGFLHFVDNECGVNLK